jgi:hypothetical protein
VQSPKFKRQYHQKKKKERKKIRSSLKMVDKGFFFLIIASKCFLTVTETPKIDVTLSSDLYGTGVLISIFVIYYFLDSILCGKLMCRIHQHLVILFWKMTIPPNPYLSPVRSFVFHLNFIFL